MSDKPEIERIAFGIVADEDKTAYIFAHAAPFLVIDSNKKSQRSHFS